MVLCEDAVHDPTQPGHPCPSGSLEQPEELQSRAKRSICYPKKSLKRNVLMLNKDKISTQIYFRVNLEISPAF